jgi:hypothetical protein
MKKTLIAVSMIAGVVGAYAQGSLNWGDAQTGMTIEILSPGTGTGVNSATVEETGQTSYDNPVGATVYTGGYIGGIATGGAAGNGPGVGPTPASGFLGINYQNAGAFTAGLYVDTTLVSLTSDIKGGTPVATTSLQGGNNDGLYNSVPGVYVSGLAPGTSVWVGIAAWYSAGGATSYASSVADSTVGGFVESTGPVALGGGSSAPAGLAGLGLTSFSLASTPEPSTIALGVIGASAFLMRLRRKQ